MRSARPNSPDTGISGLSTKRRANGGVPLTTNVPYVGIEELDPYALRKLVKAIYVDAPVEVNGKRTQHIHIQYDGIGFIPLDELLKEETA